MVAVVAAARGRRSLSGENRDRQRREVEGSWGVGGAGRALEEVLGLLVRVVEEPGLALVDAAAALDELLARQRLLDVIPEMAFRRVDDDNA